METAHAPRTPFRRSGRSSSRLPQLPLVGFTVTFLAAWFTLDRLVASPPLPANALLCLTAAAAVVVIGERIVWGGTISEIYDRLGGRRPNVRSLVAATVVGVAVTSTYFTGAALLGIDLEVRQNWLAIVVGAMVFHGLAEELVWRGYAFGHLRRTMPFWRAIAWSIPLIAMTHVPIILSNGWTVGVLAVASAALTCLPLAYLWERSGGTVWAPAILHGFVGTWQIFERTYGSEFNLVILIASMFVPLLIFPFGDRFFGQSRSSSLNTAERNHS